MTPEYALRVMFGDFGAMNYGTFSEALDVFEAAAPQEAFRLRQLYFSDASLEQRLAEHADIRAEYADIRASAEHRIAAGNTGG